MAGQPDYILGHLADIDVRLLRIFATIVERGGVTAAEPILNMANSTLTTHLATLEGLLQVRLCRRGRAGFALTPQGRQVYEAARRMFQSLDEFRAAVSQARASPPEKISMLVPDSLMCAVSAQLGPVFRRFVEALPGVSIDIDLASPSQIEASVLEGKVDIGINASPRRAHSLRFYDLLDEVVGLYCGAGHPLFDRSPQDLTAEEALSHEVIRAHGYHYPRKIVRALRGTATTSCIPLDARLLLVLTGRYLGFLTEDIARPCVQRGELREVLPNEFRYTAGIALMAKADAEEPAVLKFLEILDEVLRGTRERAQRA